MGSSSEESRVVETHTFRCPLLSRQVLRLASLLSKFRYLYAAFFPPLTERAPAFAHRFSCDVGCTADDHIVSHNDSDDRSLVPRQCIDAIPFIHCVHRSGRRKSRSPMLAHRIGFQPSPVLHWFVFHCWDGEIRTHTHRFKADDAAITPRPIITHHSQVPNFHQATTTCHVSPDQIRDECSHYAKK